MVTRITIAILMDCYQRRFYLRCETLKMEVMELAVIKYFHPNISYREGSNMEPYDPKLNTSTIWQRFHKSLWWKVTNSIPL